MSTVNFSKNGLTAIIDKEMIFKKIEKEDKSYELKWTSKRITGSDSLVSYTFEVEEDCVALFLVSLVYQSTQDTWGNVYLKLDGVVLDDDSLGTVGNLFEGHSFLAGYSNLSAGSHTITIDVIIRSGNYMEIVSGYDNLHIAEYGVIPKIEIYLFKTL